MYKIIGTDGNEKMASQYLYQQLEHRLRQNITDERWPAGEKLPSIRRLCQQQQLSKATVLHALQRLEAEGLIEARAKSGYYVRTNVIPSSQTPSQRAETLPPAAASVKTLFYDIMRRSAAFDLLPNSQDNQQSAELAALSRALGKTLRRQSTQAHLQYDEPAGDLNLRTQISRRYALRNTAIDPKGLCITSGCQHALFLALMASCKPGDVVAVESPGFYGVLQLLQQLQLQVVEVPTSPTDGMDIDALSEIVRQWQVRAVVVTPAFSTPTGAVMPEAAKAKLMAMATSHDLAIIEDDIYGETGFVNSPPPIKQLDEEGRVILCSSFSKTLSRDLRLGWIAAGRWHQNVQQLKLVTQLATSKFSQSGVAQFMADGYYSRHLKKQRYQLQHQRDQLVALLESWPVPIRYTAPNGGLALWVQLPEEVDSLVVYQRALTQDIVTTPGPLFSATEQFNNCMRISFLHPWTQKRTDALQQLPSIFAT